MRGTRPGGAGQVGISSGQSGLCQDSDPRSPEPDSEGETPGLGAAWGQAAAGPDRAGWEAGPALGWPQRASRTRKERAIGSYPTARRTVFSFQEYGLLSSPLLFDVNIGLQAQTQRARAVWFHF